MKKLLAVVFIIWGFSAKAQETPKTFTEEQYHTLWKMTKQQAELLNLNEYQFIKLLEVNRTILHEEWNKIILAWDNKLSTINNNELNTIKATRLPYFIFKKADN
jgi:hypothetical protein